MEVDTPGTGPARPESSDEVDRLLAVVQALWSDRRHAESELLLRQAEDAAATGPGPDSLTMAWVLRLRGWFSQQRRQHEQAIPACRRALAIHEARLGADHPDTIVCVEELAGILFHAARFDDPTSRDESEVLSVRAINARKAAGRVDAELAERIRDLAVRHYWVGRYADAEPLLLEALRLQTRILGSDHPATARTAQWLANMYNHCEGFAADPEPHYRQALAGFERGAGECAAEAIEARYRLADFLHRRGRNDEAEPLMQAVLSSIDRSGSSLPLRKRNWLLRGCSEFLAAAGRTEQADAIAARVAENDERLQEQREQVEWAEAMFGDRSPELAAALKRIANHAAYLGRADEAEACARRLHAIIEAQHGPEHPMTRDAARRLERIRPYAERMAQRPRPRRRVGNAAPKRFDPFSRPWTDERRSDLIRAYLDSVRLTGTEDDDPTGAMLAITGMTFTADPDTQWSVVLELIERAPEDDGVLQNLAAGPLEGLLGRFGDEVIDRAERQATLDPRFRRVLSGVWKHTMPDAVWARVRAIQATVVDPLPEMRPFSTEDGA